MTKHSTKTPQFFLTSPSPCPYLPGEFERKVFTHLVGDRAADMNDLLTQGGFRRSQNIAYRPACENCRACISVRLLAGDYTPTKSQKRVAKRNRDIISVEHTAEPSSEQYTLFRRYLDERHPTGGMADMTVLDYAMMIEDSHVNTRIIEYRLRDVDSFITGKSKGDLVGVALSDVMSDGYSMVYSFFDPELPERSLGTFMIMDHIERARAAGLPHVYLGYWVEGSPKMRYKQNFQPQEHLTGEGWMRDGDSELDD
ncbi:MAG: arginyltransferase [Pseudomonadota bacterium]